MSGSPSVQNGAAQNSGAEPDLQQILNDLVDVARKAGEMMLGARPSALAAGEKKNCEFSAETPLEHIMMHHRQTVNV